MAVRLPVIVCIPAHNEAELITRVLASLATQAGFDADRRLRVLVFANNCRDETAAVARRFARSADGASVDLDLITAELRPAKAHVGTARRKAMDLAAERLGSAVDGILLTTDADARLPRDWVTSNLRALSEAEIVGGRLIIDPETTDPASHALNRDIERYWTAVRAIEERLDPQAHDPAPRHGDHTGASLALRVSTYRKVGGVPPLRRGEDNALVALVVEAGGRLRHDPAISVRVSDRAVGRAAGGMAREMARRQAVLGGSEEYRLPAPAHWFRVVARRAALRALWRQGPEAAEARLPAFGLSEEAIAGIAPWSCSNDIAFVERTHRRLERSDDAAPLVPLARALSHFEALPAGC